MIELKHAYRTIYQSSLQADTVIFKLSEIPRQNKITDAISIPLAGEWFKKYFSENNCL